MHALQEELGAALADHYAIERELGRGGMAVVFLARDLKHDRQVAIKVLRPDLATSIGADRFLREITIAARLTHPNILTLHDSGDAGGLLYYVMPYVEGESLRQRLERERQLPVDEAVAIARQVASALDFAHSLGVVHRDIKPENILLIGPHALVADFGLARALDNASSPRLTESGIAVGTPAYVSPEQASAERSVDGRTDIYSLGCVVFEMIAGVPPFRGATAQAVIAHHVTTPPPALSEERASCPPSMDASVRRALAKTPADRFRTAGDFVRELEGGLAESAARISSGMAPRRRAWRRPVIVASLAGLVLAASAGLAFRWSRASVVLDVSRVAALPLTPVLADDSALDRIARDATRRLSDALAQWSDVHVVDERMLRDAIEDRGRSPLRTRDALALARRLGAGRLVWGDVAVTPDSVTLRTSLYDVRAGTTIREARVGYPVHAAVLAQSYRELANALLRDRGELPWARAEESWPASLAAWSAYDSARTAIDAWDLMLAEQRLRDALRIDPEFPQAELWLAQVLTWSTQERPPEETRRATQETRALALRALNLGDRLSERDRAVASGLRALADQQYPEACTAFRGVLKSMPNDFAGWYGLGDCLSRDAAVRPDRHSPSGYAFRSGWHTAASAYERALDALSGQPPAFLFRRLSKVLLTNPTAVRIGRLDSGTTVYLSPPLLMHDTLAFVPYPSRLAAAAFAQQSNVNHAVQANMDRLSRRLRAWARVAPREPLAHEMLGANLEAAGIIAPEGEDSVSALEQIRAAELLTADTLHRLELATMLVRLAVKADSFTLAARLADSLLRSVPHPSARQGESLVGLAALLGERRHAADLLAPLMAFPRFGPALPDGRAVSLPAAVLRLLADAQSRAALGVCDDTLRAFSSRLEQMLTSYFADSSERATARFAASWRVLSTGVPCLGASAVVRLDAPDVLVGLQRAFARSGAQGLRARYDSVRSARRGLRPGDVAVDYTFGEASLLLAAGDTAAAVAHLDQTLDALPTLSVYSLTFPAPAAALARAMVLRADLAARRGERATARRWASAVSTLWSHADPELAPVVQRMRSITRDEH